MSRILSAAAAEAIDAESTASVFLMLLTIDGDDLSEPVRVVRDYQTVVSRGDSFEPWPFDITLPPVGEDQPPKVQLEIDNVDRVLLASLRQATGKLTATLEVVLAESPDWVEDGPYEFTLKNTDYDALSIRSELAFEDTLSTQWPAGSYTPADYPAIFIDT